MTEKMLCEFYITKEERPSPGVAGARLDKNSGGDFK
jgi:hypothetical protein